MNPEPGTIYRSVDGCREYLVMEFGCADADHQHTSVMASNQAILPRVVFLESYVGEIAIHTERVDIFHMLLAGCTLHRDAAYEPKC